MVKIFLSIISGILLGLSFPPSPLSSLAYIAFVPLFYIFAKSESYKQTALFSYLSLFVFHLLTLYWTGGFIIGKDVWMMTAGAAVIFIHPMFFLPFILLADAVKRKIGLMQSLIAFALFWTSFEYLHSLGEYSFPWLTLGNSQAYDLNRIQMIEYISIYGLTLYIFAFNILSFTLLWNFAYGKRKLLSSYVCSLVAVLIVVYFAPLIYGRWVIKSESIEQNNEICVGIVQPNIDPWEKWGGSFSDKWESYFKQTQIYIDETKLLARSNPDIVFWPETAIPFHILLPRYSRLLTEILSLVDSINIPVFTGLTTLEYFDSSNAPATAEKTDMPNLFVESYNSAVIIKPKHTLGQIHKKSILVPFAERIPYAETFKFLVEPLKWNVGISSWGKGEDTVVYPLILKDSCMTKFSGMICYESVYPNYVREFVKRGAEFLVIITNDSWWGHTSGAYQHASYASLRAIETRRWVVQCANGGISMVIDPTGKTCLSTELYTKASFISNIYARTDETFYVKYGDIVAQLCIAVSILMILMLIVQKKNPK